MRRSEIRLEKRSLIVLLMVFFVGFVWLMKPFVMSLLLAAILATLLFPPYTKLKLKLGGRPRLSSFCMTTLVFVGLILPFAFVITSLIEQTILLLQALNLHNLIQQMSESSNYQLYVEPFLNKLRMDLPEGVDLIGTLTNLGKSLAVTLSTLSLKVLIGTPQFLFDFFVMMAAIYFLFLEGPRVFRIVLDISPLRKTHENRLILQFRNTIEACVYGYLMTALVQAILSGIVFAISGLSGAVVLGALTFFMSMVPIVGAAGVWLPVTIWFFATGQTGLGVFNLIFGAFVISGIDNFLKPIIIQGRTQIHPLLVFFSLFGGISLLGPLGILFGPVITALLIATIKLYKEEYV